MGYFVYDAFNETSTGATSGGWATLHSPGQSQKSVEVFDKEGTSQFRYMNSTSIKYEYIENDKVYIFIRPNELGYVHLSNIENSEKTDTDNPTPEKTLTIDGYSANNDILTEEVPLWVDLNNPLGKGVAGKVNHGDKVKLVKHIGVGVLVETQSGVQGWTSYHLIKEYK